MKINSLQAQSSGRLCHCEVHEVGKASVTNSRWLFIPSPPHVSDRFLSYLQTDQLPCFSVTHLMSCGCCQDWFSLDQSPRRIAFSLFAPVSQKYNNKNVVWTFLNSAVIQRQIPFTPLTISPHPWGSSRIVFLVPRMLDQADWYQREGLRTSTERLCVLESRQRARMPLQGLWKEAALLKLFNRLKKAIAGSHFTSGTPLQRSELHPST